MVVFCFLTQLIERSLNSAHGFVAPDPGGDIKQMRSL